MRLGERGDLARLRDAADAVGVELDVVHGARLDQFAETVERELVLAAGDRNAAEALQLRVAVDVVGDDRLFEPAQVETARAAAACAWRSRDSSPCRRRP